MASFNDAMHRIQQHFWARVKPDNLPPSFVNTVQIPSLLTRSWRHRSGVALKTWYASKSLTAPRELSIFFPSMLNPKRARLKWVCQGWNTCCLDFVVGVNRCHVRPVVRPPVVRESAREVPVKRRLNWIDAVFATGWQSSVAISSTWRTLAVPNVPVVVETKYLR